MKRVTVSFYMSVRPSVRLPSLVFLYRLITTEYFELQFSNLTDREVDHYQQVIPIYFRSKVKVNMAFNADISIFT